MEQVEKYFTELSLDEAGTKTLEKLKALDDCFVKEEEELQKKILALEIEFRNKVKPFLTERDEVIKDSNLEHFWLRALLNNDRLREMVEPTDIPILEHLTNISVEYPEDEDQSFKLHFTFSENPWFTNTVLTKEYKLVLDGHMESLESITSTEIDWKEDKNVTQKVVTKVQRNKRTAQTRTITETVDNPSFFFFFRSHSLPAEEEIQDMDDTQLSNLHVLMQADFEAARKIREYIVPRAVTWYMNEGEDSDDGDMDYEGDEDEDEEDEEDEDGEEAGAKGENKEKCEQQ